MVIVRGLKYQNLPNYVLKYLPMYNETHFILRKECLDMIQSELDQLKLFNSFNETFDDFRKLQPYSRGKNGKYP